MGKIVAFYSHKGGVGSTMALSNIAVLLAKWHNRVLIVDWDIEDSQIPNIFGSYLNRQNLASHRGILDFVYEASGNTTDIGEEINWTNYSLAIQIPGIIEPIYLVTSGRRDNESPKRLQKLDMLGQSFFFEKGGIDLIKRLHNEWKMHYDFVLINGRKSISDLGGISTLQFLPDIILLFMKANKQSFIDVLEFARKAISIRQQLPPERPQMTLVPVLGRHNISGEREISDQWLSFLSEELSDVYDSWLPHAISIRNMLGMTIIPEIGYYKTSERLAVVEEGILTSLSLGYAYGTLAALVAHNLDAVDQLFVNRFEYVQVASQLQSSLSGFITNQDIEKVLNSFDIVRPPMLKVFISYKWEDAHNAWVTKLASDLRKAGIETILDKWEVRYGDSFTDYMTSRIAEADVVLFIMTTKSVAAVEAPKGGGGAVKFEMQIISARKIDGESVRLIPIYREGNKTATHVLDHRYADFRDDSKYEENLKELINDLLGRDNAPPID